MFIILNNSKHYGEERAKTMTTGAVESTVFRTFEAEVVRLPTGMYGALLLEGPDAGQVWALAGSWMVGRRMKVRYHPEDQFADPVF
jgi:hypothetical protein